MSLFEMNRRAVIPTSVAFFAASLTPVSADEHPAIHIVKDPNCGCCTEWARVLDAEGFSVSMAHRSGEDLERLKQSAGIPQALWSCHTAAVDGYLIEGHVPPADIRRLLAERPAAIGLAVPGMPYGAPGMGPEDERDAYTVYLMHQDGSAQVFAEYPAA